MSHPTHDHDHPDLPPPTVEEVTNGVYAYKSYNLFGYVIDGIDVAQKVQQGDVMRSVSISERASD